MNKKRTHTSDEYSGSINREEHPINSTVRAADVVRGKRVKGVLHKQAGEAGPGIATLRAQTGKMVSSSKGKREVLVKHYRKLQ